MFPSHDVREGGVKQAAQETCCSRHNNKRHGVVDEIKKYNFPVGSRIGPPLEAQDFVITIVLRSASVEMGHR